MDEQKIEIIVVAYILSKMKLDYEDISGNKLFMSYLATALKEIKNILPNLNFPLLNKTENDWTSEDTHAVMRIISNSVSLYK